MLSSNGLYKAEVIIRGRGEITATEVAHEGQTYVEGRDGTEYLLRFQNLSVNNVLIVPSVDGLSVIDGKPAGLDSGGYVVKPNQIITVPGWMVDQKTAAKFVFAKKGTFTRDPAKKTYAEQRGTDPSNIGVIGLAVFAEKIKVVPPPVYVPVPTYPPYPGFWQNQPFYNGMPPYTLTGTACPPLRATVQLNNQTDLSNLSETSLSVGAVAASANAIEKDIIGSNSLDSLRARSAPEPRRITLNTASPQIGTGFGEATSFSTESRKFERETPDTPEMVFSFIYDSLNNLERIGVPVDQFRSKKAEALARNPFPASQGCVPPTGWKKP